MNDKELEILAKVVDKSDHITPIEFERMVNSIGRADAGVPTGVPQTQVTTNNTNKR